MGQYTAMRLLIGAVIVIGVIVVRVGFGTFGPAGYRDLDSGTVTIGPGQAMTFDIQIRGASKLKYEATRTTPGPISVDLMDTHNHQRVQATPAHLPIPADVVSLHKNDGNTTVSAQDIPVGAGKYFLYINNSDPGPITVTFRIQEFR
jgi:hypothetical protein